MTKHLGVGEGPYWPRTILCVGDTHFGASNVATRWAIAKPGLLKLPLAMAAAVIQVGDVTEATAHNQDANARTELQAIGVDRVIYGNHDLVSPAPHRTGAQAAASINLNPGGAKDWILDLSFARLIGVTQPTHLVSHILLDTAERDYIEDAAADTELPCIVFAHAPLYNTVLADGPAPAGYSSDNGYQLTPDAEIRAALDAHANIKALISGHTHSEIRRTGFVKRESVGTRHIAYVNASAIRGTSNPATLGDPIRCVAVTYTPDGRVEVRPRDLQTNAWLTWPDTGQRVKAVMPT